MCLVTKTNEPSIATEEIKVYKKCCLLPNNEIFSYYGWLNNNHRYSKIEEAVIIPEQSLNFTYSFVINKGLHGKLSLDHLILEDGDNLSFYGEQRVVLTEWIIPIGTKYYSEIYVYENNIYETVASEKLIFSKFITEVEEDKILWRE